MFYKFCFLFMMFFISSVIGYICEIIFCSIGNRKLVLNRGFLIGPYIPIYGVGTVGCYIAFNKYASDPLVLFSMSLIGSTILEYITSYVMEKIFKVRWWDYSTELFNLNGRVCIKNSIIFGFIGLAVINYVYPFISGIVSLIPSPLLEILAILFSIIFIIDITFTTVTLFGIRSKLEKLNKKDITLTAHNEVMKQLRKHSYNVNRLLQAFPNNEKFNRKEYDQLKRLVYDYRKNKRKKLDKVKKVSKKNK